MVSIGQPLWNFVLAVEVIAMRSSGRGEYDEAVDEKRGSVEQSTESHQQEKDVHGHEGSGYVRAADV